VTSADLTSRPALCLLAVLFLPFILSFTWFYRRTLSCLTPFSVICQFRFIIVCLSNHWVTSSIVRRVRLNCVAIFAVSDRWALLVVHFHVFMIRICYRRFSLFQATCYVRLAWGWLLNCPWLRFLVVLPSLGRISLHVTVGSLTFLSSLQIRSVMQYQSVSENQNAGDVMCVIGTAPWHEVLLPLWSTKTWCGLNLSCFTIRFFFEW
jgi:hypothetical protein